MKLINTKDSSHSAKTFNESKKIAEILSGKQEETALLKESNEFIQEIQKDEMANTVSSTFNREKVKRLESKNKASYIELETKRLQGDFFSQLVTRSVPFEKSGIKTNLDYIKKQSFEIGAGQMERYRLEGSQTAESGTMRTILEMIDNHVLESVNEEPMVRSAMEKELKAKLESYLDYVAPNVRFKVVEAIKIEKRYTNIQESLSEKEASTSSLMRELINQNIKQCMFESKALELNEEIMETAFTESILDYTILEALNTLRIVNFNTIKLSEGVKSFFKLQNAKSSFRINESGKSLGLLNLPKETDSVRFVVGESIQAEFLNDSGSLIGEPVCVKLSESVSSEEDTIRKLKQEFVSTNLRQRNFGVNFSYQSENKKGKL